MKTLRTHSLFVRSKPADVDIAIEDGGGSISVSFTRHSMNSNKVFDVTIQATGEYESWTDEELKDEASIILAPSY